MLIGIDGTGPANDGEYSRVMKNSFVSQLQKDDKGRAKMYFRGPGGGWVTHKLPGKSVADQIFGTSTEESARNVMIAARVAIRAGDTVHLAGYSRGGAVAIRVAQLMKIEFPDAKIPVIALFDAVDRSELKNVTRVPGNVVKAFHALRDPIVSSRSYFGNCGTVSAPPCVLKKLTFVTTHGGMGGVPFPDSIEEAFTVKISANMEFSQSGMVRRWMWANLRKEGVV